MSHTILRRNLRMTVTAADVLYDRDNHHYLMQFLRRAPQVVLADSRMQSESIKSYRVIKHTTAVTTPDLNESEQFNRVKIYQRKKAFDPVVSRN